MSFLKKQYVIRYNIIDIPAIHKVNGNMINWRPLSGTHIGKYVVRKKTPGIFWRYTDNNRRTYFFHSE